MTRNLRMHIIKFIYFLFLTTWMCITDIPYNFLSQLLELVSSIIFLTKNNIFVNYLIKYHTTHFFSLTYFKLMFSYKLLIYLSYILSIFVPIINLFNLYHIFRVTNMDWVCEGIILNFSWLWIFKPLTQFRVYYLSGDFDLSDHLFKSFWRLFSL